MAPDNAIYSATYSNVPVYEFNVGDNHVMRRRYDDFINATHILKVADYDKPARTRILEREVQKGFHEKIQGGYGKYQGTWIPLQDGRALAERNGVLDKLRPIFDFVPGNSSPPPAPKHTSTAAARPKAPKVARKAAVQHAFSQMSDDFDNGSSRLRDDESQDNSTVETASFIDGDESYGQTYVPGSRKRKRPTQQDLLDQQHVMYADALLDYFMLSTSEVPAAQKPRPPLPPDNFQVDRAIDDQGHTALHWAASMADLDIVKIFLDRGANPEARNNRGETPIIRAVLFTNNFEKQSMPKLVNMLLKTVRDRDVFGGNIIHHICMAICSQAKRQCACYYLDVILHKLAEVCTTNELTSFLNQQDRQGDTPLHLAALHKGMHCVRALLARGVQSDIPNSKGQTSDQILRSLQSVQKDLLAGSSPPPYLPFENKKAKAGIVSHYHTEPARSFSQSFESMAQEKALQVSLALDSELKEKEEDLADSQRILEKLEKEGSLVRQRILQLMNQNGSETDEEIRSLTAEETTLKETAIALAEELQQEEMDALLASEEVEPSTVAEDDLSGLENKLRAAHELAAEQRKLKELTKTFVEAQASAGMSQNGEALKRLVSSTTGVPEDQVAALVPELLQTLEEAQIDPMTEVDVAA